MQKLNSDIVKIFKFQGVFCIMIVFVFYQIINK